MWRCRYKGKMGGEIQIPLRRYRDAHKLFTRVKLSGTAEHVNRAGEVTFAVNFEDGDMSGAIAYEQWELARFVEQFFDPDRIAVEVLRAEAESREAEEAEMVEYAERKWL